MPAHALSIRRNGVGKNLRGKKSVTQREEDLSDRVSTQEHIADNPLHFPIASYIKEGRSRFQGDRTDGADRNGAAWRKVGEDVRTME